MASTNGAQRVTEDPRPYQWLASYLAARAVRLVRDADLDRPTPCEHWSVRDLVRHMVGCNRGFGAELEGHPSDPGVWDGLDLGVDPRPHWDESARRVVAAFAARSPMSGAISVPGFGLVPVSQAAQMHAIDYLVHAWDLGAAIDHKPELPEDACHGVLAFAATWPPGHPEIWGPGAPFGHPVSVAQDAPASDRMLALLGRTPAWPEHL
jgi:uncharacterized protein (TIGR03086 family)